MSEDQDRVSLPDAIDGLRRQLMEAARRAQSLDKDAPRFRISSIEVELTVALEKSSGAGLGGGWWVFQAKADIGAKDIVTHKVKLSLDVGDIKIGSHTKTTR